MFIFPPLSYCQPLRGNSLHHIHVSRSMVVKLLLLLLSPVPFPGAASLISGVFRSRGPGRCPSKSKSCSRKWQWGQRGERKKGSKGCRADHCLSRNYSQTISAQMLGLAKEPVTQIPNAWSFKSISNQQYKTNQVKQSLSSNLPIDLLTETVQCPAVSNVLCHWSLWRYNGCDLPLISMQNPHFRIKTYPRAKCIQHC